MNNESRAGDPRYPKGRTSKLALVSAIFGILGCTGILGIAGLIGGIVSLVRIRKSNGRLRGKDLAIGAICFSLLTLSMFVASYLDVTRSRRLAHSITCVYNLKQISLGARIYADDNHGVFPPDFLTMSNGLGSPRILHCPADLKRQRAGSEDWALFNPTQVSYEYLTPGAREETVTNRVVFRCPIHGHTCLGDGTVLRGDLKPGQSVIKSR